MTFKHGLWRVALGFVLAPLVPAALLSLVSTGGLGMTLLFATYGAYPPALVLGIPAYFLLRKRLQPRLVTAAAAGGLMAAVPWLFLLPQGGTEQATVGKCVAVLNGNTTWCGHLLDLQWIAMAFGLGCVGGIVFWLCVVWRADAITSRPGTPVTPTDSGTVHNG